MKTTLRVLPVSISDDRAHRAVVKFKVSGSEAKVIVTFPHTMRSAATSLFAAKGVTLTMERDSEGDTTP